MSASIYLNFPNLQLSAAPANSRDPDQPMAATSSGSDPATRITAPILTRYSTLHNGALCDVFSIPCNYVPDEQSTFVCSSPSLATTSFVNVAAEMRGKLGPSYDPVIPGAVAAIHALGSSVSGAGSTCCAATAAAASVYSSGSDVAARATRRYDVGNIDIDDADLERVVDEALMSEGAAAPVYNSCSAGAARATRAALASTPIVHDLVGTGGSYRYAPRENIVGASEWRRFGNPGIVPPLPSYIDEIMEAECPFNPGRRVRDTHICVLVPETLNGVPLTLGVLRNHIPGAFFDLRDGADNIAPNDSHWVLMTRDVIPGSRNQSYNEQALMVRDRSPYEIPSVRDATICILMHHAQTGERLYGGVGDNRVWIRCRESTLNRGRMLAGDFRRNRLYVGGGFSDHGHPTRAVAAIRVIVPDLLSRPMTDWQVIQASWTIVRSAEDLQRCQNTNQPIECGMINPARVYLQGFMERNGCRDIAALVAKINHRSQSGDNQLLTDLITHLQQAREMMGRVVDSHPWATSPTVVLTSVLPASATTRSERGLVDREATRI